MSIIWFDTVPRLSSRIEPLTRAGFLPGKNYPVERVFDHMAFSYRTGAPDVEFKILWHGREKIIRQPHCMLMLPGEYSLTEPLKPCVFVVYSQATITHSLNQTNFFTGRNKRIV